MCLDVWLFLLYVFPKYLGSIQTFERGDNVDCMKFGNYGKYGKVSRSY